MQVMELPFYYFMNLKGKAKYSYGKGLKKHKKRNEDALNIIRKYNNIHCGKKCFIVGTGPSLNLQDIELLKQEYCIGVNTLFKLFKKTDWRPNCYCIIDPKTYGNIMDEFERYQIPFFYPLNRINVSIENGIPFELDCSDFYKLHAIDLFEFTNFSGDAADRIFDGASVVYAALQIAVYMGFKEIYLLGVDCNYTLPRDQLHNEELSYSKDYKYNWTENTGLTMIEGFKIAKKYADAHDIRIYNATRGGMLEVFPRVKLEEVVSNDAD